MTLAYRSLYIALITALNVFSTVIFAADSSYRSLVTDRHSDSIRHLTWHSNQHSETWAEPNPEYGSTVYLNLLEFPTHLRRFGPDSNHSLAPLLQQLHLPLIAQHPLDQQWIPMLAQRWSIDEANQRIFFELNKTAHWSDGEPVSTLDIRFSFEFLLNPRNQTDFQRHRIQQLIAAVEIFDDQRFAITSKQPLSNDIIRELASFKPLAAHFYRNLDWPIDANWSIEPVTGPYYLQQIHHNDSLTLRRTTKWWGNDLRFFAGRFNIARVVLLLSNSDNAFQKFKRAELDLLSINSIEQQHSLVQKLWHDNRINMHSWQQTGQNGLIILNNRHERLNTRAKRLQILQSLNQQRSITLPIISNDANLLGFFSKSSHSDPHQIISATELEERLQNNNFSVAWIKFSSPLDTISAEAWLKRLGYSLHDESTVQLQGNTALQYSLSWAWLHLPQNLKHWPTTPFDLFDAVTGGLVWVDKRERAEIIQNPERVNASKPQLINTSLTQ